MRAWLCHRRPQLVPASGQGVPQVVPCQLSELAALSSVRIYISKDLRPLESRQLGLKVRVLTPSFGCLMGSKFCHLCKVQKLTSALRATCLANCMQRLGISACVSEQGSSGSAFQLAGQAPWHAILCSSLSFLLKGPRHPLACHKWACRLCQRWGVGPSKGLPKSTILTCQTLHLSSCYAGCVRGGALLSPSVSTSCRCCN